MKTKISIIIALLVVFAIGGCNYSQQKKKSTNKKEVLKIGAILPLTGVGSEYGVDQKNGIQMAETKINKQNKEINVNYYDSQGEPKIAVNIVRQINNKTNVFLSTLSNVSMSIKPFIKNNSLLITIASNPDLTKDNQNIIRMLPTSGNYAKELDKYINKNVSVKATVFIVYADNDFGHSLFQNAKSDLSQHFSIKSFPYPTGFSNFKNIVNKIRPDIDKDDIILLFGYSKSLGFFIKQARESKINNTIFSTPEISYPETKNIAGDAYHKIEYVTLSVDTTEKSTKQFIQDYKNKFHKTPSLDAYLGHDELMLFYKAYKKNPKDYITAIRQITYQGFFGNLNVDSSGNVIFELKMKTIR